jgi:hypothetical protein
MVYSIADHRSLVADGLLLFGKHVRTIAWVLSRVPRQAGINTHMFHSPFPMSPPLPIPSPHRNPSTKSVIPGAHQLPPSTQLHPATAAQAALVCFIMLDPYTTVPESACNGQLLTPGTFQFILTVLFPHLLPLTCWKPCSWSQPTLISLYDGGIMGGVYLPTHVNATRAACAWPVKTLASAAHHTSLH